MARKTKVKSTKTTREDTSLPYVKGDFCYYLSNDNKVLLGEVNSVSTHTDGSLLYTIIDQVSYKFLIVESIFCHDEETFFKKKKRQDIKMEVSKNDK